MQRKIVNILIYFCAGACYHAAHSQNTSITVDTSYSFQFLNNIIFNLPVFTSEEYLTEQEPQEGDTAFIAANHHLLKPGPNYKNYSNYASLAAAYYRAGKIAVAKKMFLTIVASKEPYYTGTLFHSAGNTYEYGSYTSSFKNEACKHLCKIFLKEKNYQQAIDYLIKADKLYKIQFNCGTGNNFYRNQLNSLYVACYKGLGNWDKVIDLYLQENFYHDDDFISIIRKKYSPADVKRYLQIAASNITIKKDEWETTVTTRDDAGEDSIVAKYINGTAYTILFGRKVNLPSPTLDNGDTITRKKFIDDFISSDFYTKLLDIKKPRDTAGL